MIRKALLSSVVFAAALAAQAPTPTATAVMAPAPERPIDLAICLDVSGSMDGLLNAARQNLWAVVNELATLKPAPQLRVALLTYGCQAYDAETGWVRVDADLTSDLDTVSQQLFALTTNGGDEYVGRVLQAALQQLHWSEDPNALKLLFVAGNEPATQDPKVDFREQCKLAIGRGIVVNSIYCGRADNAEAGDWSNVAKLADGRFAAIDQDHGVVITTPFDAQLAALSAELNKTYVPFGQKGTVAWENQRAQDVNAASLNVAAAAQRCQTKGNGVYDNAGWDLVDACRDPKFELDKVKPEDLPEAMRGMDLEHRREFVAAQQKQRDALRVQVEALGKQRDADVQRQLQQQVEAGKAVFEQAVLETVRQQAEAKGFARPAPTPAPSAAPAKEGEKAPAESGAGLR